MNRYGLVFIAAALSSLSTACASSSAPASRGSVTPSSGPVAEFAPAEDRETRDRLAACEGIRDVVRTSYDSSGPGVSCDDIRTAAVGAAFSADLPPSAQAAIADLCGNACNARKRGIGWTTISRALRCD